MDALIDRLMTVLMQRRPKFSDADEREDLRQALAEAARSVPAPVRPADFDRVAEGTALHAYIEALENAVTIVPLTARGPTLTMWKAYSQACVNAAAEPGEPRFRAMWAAEAAISAAASEAEVTISKAIDRLVLAASFSGRTFDTDPAWDAAITEAKAREAELRALLGATQ